MVAIFLIKIKIKNCVKQHTSNQGMNTSFYEHYFVGLKKHEGFVITYSLVECILL